MGARVFPSRRPREKPLRLGLAGGPLVVALLLGRWGRLGPFPCHMPASANLAFRDFGIALFFAAVGLAAGPRFLATVFSEAGMAWLVAGILVTVVPLLGVGWLARRVGGVNFAALSGLLAGSMTAPPALAFARDRARSDVPTLAYAMVYPLAMLLRVLAAQALAVIVHQAPRPRAVAFNDPMNPWTSLPAYHPRLPFPLRPSAAGSPGRAAGAARGFPGRNPVFFRGSGRVGCG